MSSWISDEQFSNPPAADVKNHGLFNQGATCYLNSVLQVLFMTKDFREAVERHTCENSSNPCTEHMDCHLKHLFSDLQKGTASTNEITDKLGIHRVNEQRDAAEYFERILALTSPDASQIFHGELTHKTICSTCHKEENTDGLFWLLPLELVDSYSEHYSVVDGTEEYFRASYFTGENQMYCNHCDFKCDAATKCVVKRYPEVLVLLLKRFKFDFSHMTYVKNSSAVAVPCTLQIPENQMYDLYATVEHVGYLRGGHYTATIKSQEDERWYHFSDTRVTLLHYQDQLLWSSHTKESHTAYLLFYRKKTTHAANTCTDDIGELSTGEGFLPSTREDREQGQDAERTTERMEDKDTVQVGNDSDASEDVSINRNEETGSRDVVSVGSGRVVVSPDLISNVEDQDKGIDGDNRDDEQVVGVDEDDEVGKTGAHKAASGRGKSLTKYDLYCEGLDNIRKGGDRKQDRLEDDQRHKQEVEQNDGHEPLPNIKEGHDEKMAEGDEEHEVGKTGAHEAASGRGKSLTKYDLYCEGLDNSRKGGDRKQDRPEDDQGCKQGSDEDKNDGSHEREEERDVKGDEEPKGGEDESTQRKGADTARPYLNEGVEDQRRSDDVTQNRPEQKISMTHKDVCVEERAEEQENEGDEKNFKRRRVWKSYGEPES